MSELTPAQYESLLAPLSLELADAARWVAETGQRVVIILEGRDTAGKGGTIYALSRNLNPRQCRSVALPSPSLREQGEWYFQRYVEHLPAQGEIVLFDRSWYNRAGVESVMGFASPEEVEEFLRAAPTFERQLVEDGIFLFKYWLCCSQEKQEKRFADRLGSPLKRWKISPIDIEARARYDAYTEARERMLRATHTRHAPWTLLNFDDQPAGRLTLMRDFLDRLPDTQLPLRDIPWPQLPHSPKDERYSVLQPLASYLDTKDRPRAIPRAAALAATAAMEAMSVDPEGFAEGEIAAAAEPATEPRRPAETGEPPSPPPPPPAAAPLAVLAARPLLPTAPLPFPPPKVRAMPRPLRLFGQVSLYYLALIAIVAAAVWMAPSLRDYLPIGGAKGLVAQTADPGLTGKAALRAAAAVPHNMGQTLLYLVTAILGALATSLPVAWVYMGIRTDDEYDQSLIATVIMLPVVVTGIVVIVQNSLALAFSLAGIAGAVRFKNDLKSSGDALFILLAVGIGLSSGIGAVELALIMSLAFNYTFIGLWWSEFGERAGMKRYLTDCDPEDPQSLNDPWRGIGGR